MATYIIVPQGIDPCDVENTRVNGSRAFAESIAESERNYLKVRHQVDIPHHVREAGSL